MITIGTFGCFHIKNKHRDLRSKEEIIIHDPIPVRDMIFPDDKGESQFPKHVEFGEDDSKKNETSWWPWN